MRNVEFFGGGLSGLIGVLDHGYGHYFIGNYWFVLLWLVGLGALILLKQYIVMPTVDSIVYQMILIGFAGGMFGYSTMMIAIPSIFFIAYIKAHELLLRVSYKGFL